MNFQDNVPVTKRSIKKQIVEAQSLAKDAVKADNFHCYEEAILLYETAINEIKQILETVENERINNHNENVISETDFILLQNIHSAYYDRLNFLKVNTDKNYTSNLKNIEIDSPPKIYNANLRQQAIQQEYGLSDIELQRMKKIQEYQNNLDLFENLDFYNMQNKQALDDQKRTQNMNDMSEMLYEDPIYGDIKPPSYTKSTNYNVPVVKNKFGFFMDEESNVTAGLVSNPNNNIFNNLDLSNPDLNKLNTNPETKNSIEPIASNNIFIQKMNNNEVDDLPIDSTSPPINNNMGVNPNMTRNISLSKSINNSNSTPNINASNPIGITSPTAKVIPISVPPIPSNPVNSEKPPYIMNENSSMVGTPSLQQKTPKPLQVQIPKRDPSLSRNKSNPYVVPFSSKLISQPTPTTPTTAYLSFAAESQGNKDMPNPPLPNNSLPYSIEYLLMEKPHNVPKPEMLPPKLIMRPFWLMRLLSRSMYEGGYLTPRMYVPKQLWYQRGVKYVAIETKYQACINLVQHLQKIRNTNVENSSEVYEVLRGLENEMEAIQNMLSKKLKYIDEIIELGAVVSLDKKITMSLLWKYGFELNLMREIPYEEDATRNGENGNDPLFSTTGSHFHGEDHVLSRTNEFGSAIGMKSNNGYGMGMSMANDDLIKSTRSITDITNGRIQDNIIEEEVFGVKGPGAYSISSISINSNVTSSSKLAHTKSRLSRSMDKFTNKKGEKVGDVSGYIEVLISLFNQAQFFVEWINYIEAKGKANPNELQYAHIHNQLGRISYFFGRVICTFVLKDFEMLLDRYLYKLRQNIFF